MQDGGPGRIDPKEYVAARRPKISREAAVSGKSDVNATLAELATAFPAAFTPGPNMVRPLKLGIRDDLYAQTDISHRRITAALRLYCKAPSYLEACNAGALRVDLAGQPAGTVTDAEAEHAAAALAELAKIATKRRDQSVAKGAPADASVPKQSSSVAKGKAAGAPTAAGPRRLSLDDLRKAAAARKKSDPR
jgi:sRNA-binding protein